jgi:hypothetical protein
MLIISNYTNETRLQLLHLELVFELVLRESHELGLPIKAC